MFAGSLVLAVTLLTFAAWLHWNDSRGWPEESCQSELDSRYLNRRKRSRKRIHVIIAISGGLILVAAFAGPGLIWIAAWMCVMLALVTVMLLAGLDAFRTHRYHLEKLPEVRRQVFNNCDDRYDAG